MAILAFIVVVSTRLTLTTRRLRVQAAAQASVPWLMNSAQQHAGVDNDACGPVSISWCVANGSAVGTTGRACTLEDCHLSRILDAADTKTLWRAHTQISLAGRWMFHYVNDARPVQVLEIGAWRCGLSISLASMLRRHRAAGHFTMLDRWGEDFDRDARWPRHVTASKQDLRVARRMWRKHAAPVKGRFVSSDALRFLKQGRGPWDVVVVDLWEQEQNEEVIECIVQRGDAGVILCRADAAPKHWARQDGVAFFAPTMRSELTEVSPAASSPAPPRHAA